MINSGEAESRAVAGAVRGALGQARLDAGVTISGLLVDLGSANSVDYRQHLMCWQLTRVLRPSLTEKLPPAVVRNVVKQDTAHWRTILPSYGEKSAWSPPADLSSMPLRGEGPAAPASDGDKTGVGGHTAGAGFPHPQSGQATSDTQRCGYVRDRSVPRGLADTTNVSPHQELCCTTQRACV